MPESTTLELREQFANPEQQLETAKIGMWIFLVTEIMLFGGLFMAFTVYRMYYPQAFDVGSRGMSIVLGSVNTAVLICSSLAMAMADHSAENGNQRMLALFLILTMILGAVFLGIKFTEYYEHFQEHKVPGIWFEYSGSNPGQVQMFYVFYFLMTGLHAIHMTIGLCVLGFMLLRTIFGTFTAKYFTPIQLSGLYWHFVDIIWVFLYALFYLPGLHK